MGYKEKFLTEMIRSDLTGLLPKLHNRLVDQQLKFRASSNSDMLLYYALDSDKKQVGLAAFRVPGPTIFSFPKGFWQRRSAEVDAALSGVSRSNIIEAQGTVSSSQYSIRQVIVSTETEEILLHAIDELISGHARSILGNAQS